MSAQSMLGVIQRLSAELRALGQRTPSAPTWGTVTGINPLRVQPDTALDGPLVGDVENAAGPLAVGDRVVLQYHNRKVWAYGPIKNAARYDQDDVNGLYLHAGAAMNTAEPSFRLSRLFGTAVHKAKLYVANNAAAVEVGMIAQKNDTKLSRLMLNDRGKVVVNTYSGSGTPAGERVLPFAMAFGIVNITPSAVDTPTAATVTLPAGLFTKTPDSFTLTPISTVPERCHVSVNTRSSTSFQVYLTRATTTMTSIYWSAFQLEP